MGSTRSLGSVCRIPISANEAGSINWLIHKVQISKVDAEETGQERPNHNHAHKLPTITCFVDAECWQPML